MTRTFIVLTLAGAATLLAASVGFAFANDGASRIAIVGLGFDGLGALLLAKVLLKSDTFINRVGEGSKADEGVGRYSPREPAYPTLAREMLSDRKLGWAGVTFLVGGFLLQIVSQSM